MNNRLNFMLGMFVLMAGSSASIAEVPSSQDICLVYDLGQTLCAHNESQLVINYILPALVSTDSWYTSLQNMGAAIRYGAHARAHMYEALEHIGGPQRCPAGSLPMCDDKGHVLPQLIVDDMCGTMALSRDEILTQFDRMMPAVWSDKPLRAGLLNFIKAIIWLTFDHDAVVNHSYAIDAHMDVLDRLVTHNPDLPIYLLSNYGAEKFEQFLVSPLGKRLQKYIPRERMIVSGFIGDYKPRPSIFKYTEQLTGKSGAQILFIDDRPENRIVAEQECSWVTFDVTQLSELVAALGVAGVRGLAIG